MEATVGGRQVEVNEVGIVSVMLFVMCVSDHLAPDSSSVNNTGLV